jgi:hypothetical protein
VAAKAIKCSRIGGRIVLVGVLTGLSGQVPTVALMSRQQTPHGITMAAELIQAK